MKYKRYYELREDLKLLAKDIKKWKKCRKLEKRRELNISLDDVLCHIAHLKYHFRHKHIVYCNYMRGTPYDKIEQPSSDNSPDIIYLSKLRDEWCEPVEETIHIGA